MDLPLIACLTSSGLIGHPFDLFFFLDEGADYGIVCDPSRQRRVQSCNGFNGSQVHVSPPVNADEQDCQVLPAALPIPEGLCACLSIRFLGSCVCFL